MPSDHHIRCHGCGFLSPPTVQQCERCHAALHERIPNSIRNTFALLLTGYILYLPANLYPIMAVKQLGQGELHTIMGGILVLIEEDMLPIAILVFVASVLVPLLKLLGLSLLVAIVHFRWPVNARLWTQLYRCIAFVGRWSMLDIFMIAILVAVVDLGTMASVIAGPAATAFASVVVVTMFAAIQFDPRLLWDIQESHCHE